LLKGNPDPAGFLRILLITVISALLYHSMGAFAALVTNKTRNVGGFVVVLIALLNGVLNTGSLGAFTIIPTCL
jgi:cation transporter-like permease